MVPNPMILARQIGILAMANSPSILTGLAVGGVVTTFGMGVDATIKSVRLVDEEIDLRKKDAAIEGYDDGLPLTKMEVLQLVWKEYAPAVGIGLITVLCIIGVNKIHIRRNAALVGLYELADTTLREYRAKVVETIGEKKEMEIRDSIIQDNLNKNPIDQTSVIVTTAGSTYCYEPVSSRYFLSDVSIILKAQNDFNSRLLRDQIRPINEFYDEIGLEPTSIGDDVGWALKDGQGLMEIRFSSKLEKGNRPCLVLDFKNGPKPI
jgi:hypothetical protein